MPSGRLWVCREVYIHPNSTKLSFNHVLTFSLASVCTLGRTSLLHVALLTGTWLMHEICAAQRNVRFINLFEGNWWCNDLSVWSNRLRMTTEMIKVYVLSSMTFTSILNIIACRVMCIACSVVAEFFPFLLLIINGSTQRRFNQQRLKYLMQRMFWKADRCVLRGWCVSMATYMVVGDTGSPLCICVCVIWWIYYG